MKKLPLLLLPLLLAACAKNHATGGHNFTLVSNSKERELGEAAARNTLIEDGLYRPASTASQYVTEVCNKVYAATENPAAAVQCNLIDSDVINAHATPGYIMMERGILPFMNSEDELAFVLGHESGHLTARHVNQRYTQSAVTGALSAAAVVAVAATADSDDIPTVQGAAAATGLAGGVALATYSRGHEAEADTLGRRYAQKAGYNPAASVTENRHFLLVQKYLDAQQTAFNNGNIAPKSLFNQLKSSHPATPDRVAAALKATGEPAPIPPSEDISRQRYLKAIDGLAWGPARRYGIARKAELVLPRQRVIIPLPDATTTAYRGSGKYHQLGNWYIAHPQSGAYLTVTSVPLPAGQNPGTYLKTLLPMLHGDIQRIQIGVAPSQTEAEAAAEAADTQRSADIEDENRAYDAAFTTAQTIGYTATYRYLNSSKRYRMVALSSPATVDAMITFTIVYPNQQVLDHEDANLLNILKNVRYLTKQQAKKYQQLQLHTFTAATGQTVAQQAAHLPVSALNEDLFRALNNLPTGTEMVPGQLYKTIIDPNP